jgi:predicted component of type VI protein secretion system
MGMSFPSTFLDRMLAAHDGFSGPRRLDEFGRQGLDGYLESLARDVENLLNTVATNPGRSRGGAECSASVLTYGLPDRAYFPGEPAELAELIARALATFEPRLKDLRAAVAVPDPARPDSYVLEVQARLADQPLWSVLLTTSVGDWGRGVKFVTVSPVSDA